MWLGSARIGASSGSSSNQQLARASAILVWLTAQTTATLITAQTCTILMWDTLPHLNARCTSTSQIEGVIELHILQVKEAVTPANNKDKDEFFSHDIFKVFTTEKKKHGDKASKAPELSALLPPTPAPATTSATTSDNSYLDI